MQRRGSGATTLAVVVAMVALLALASIALDGGIVWAARAQLQNATDAAALGGAANLFDSEIQSVTLDLAEATAVDLASRHSAVSTDAVDLSSEAGNGVTFGEWDMDTRSFDPTLDPDRVNAVNVVARLDGVANGPIPAFLSRVVGRDNFVVASEATAYLGYAGKVASGEIDLPIGIDCCKIAGDDCKQDFCATIANPPNSCALSNAQLEGATTVSCLDFQPTMDQNACWTAFDETDSSVNTPRLLELVQLGSPVELTAGAPYYADNGDKTPIFREIKDRFEGTGDYEGAAAGTDRYAGPGGGSDSWVVAFPVFSCQSDSHCAGGSPARVEGFVCFEIREVEDAPGKVIRGRFLCSGDALMSECNLGPTGSSGKDFGIRADIPLLVR